MWWVFAVVLLVALPSFAQTTFRCESLDGKYRECRVAGDGNLILAKQLSDTNCVQGRTWGYRDDGVVWVDAGCRADFKFTPLDQLNMLVLCESADGKLNRCPADIGGGVRLARQVSDSACRFGRDWGYDANGIWVNNGCRGEFGVRSVSVARSVTVAPPDPVIICQSINNDRSHCDADTSMGITLWRQISENPCVLNRTWGIDDDGIWVTDGCRGQFTSANIPTMTMISAAPPASRAIITTRTATALPGSIVCESVNNARSHCRTDTSMGITLVRQFSDNVCVRDRTWGVDKDGVWVTGGCRAEFALGTAPTAVVLPPAAPVGPVLVCESIDGRRNHCPTDTSMGVNLLRQISDSDCTLNRTWGVDASGIWVTDGCRAEFTLGNARMSLGDAPQNARVLCESKDGQRTVCPADTRMGVAVVRQLSDTNCRYNSTWGFDANGIWVTAGCRAEFILRR
jgi:hypothetical protein